jgi:hypothetical protein
MRDATHNDENTIEMRSETREAAAAHQSKRDAAMSSKEMSMVRGTV